MAASHGTIGRVAGKAEQNLTYYFPFEDQVCYLTQLN